MSSSLNVNDGGANVECLEHLLMNTVAVLDNRIRVLQVATDTDHRGGPVFARDLHRPLAQRGFTVRTVSLAPGAVGGLDLPTLGPSRLHMSTLAALRRLMATADVVIAHGSTTLPACAVAGAGLNTPFVYRNLGDPMMWASSPRRRLQTRALLGRAAAVAALWPGAAHALTAHLGVAPSKIRVIPIGADPQRYRPATDPQRATARAELDLDPHAPVAAFVGALSPEKDVGVAIDAVAELEGVQLVVAGDGPERATLERHAADRAPDQVRFIGRIDDPRTVYAAAHCLVLPSRTEGLPAVLIEAGLSGLPVVASDVGGISEIVIPATGQLVPPGDPAAVATALRDVLARPAACAEAARHRCEERFSLERVASHWARLLTVI